jgi:YVTN family beta-propeller protein
MTSRMCVDGCRRAGDRLRSGYGERSRLPRNRGTVDLPSENPVEFRLLGPLELRGDDGAPIDLGGRQQRLIVAYLLLRANQAVSVDSLADALWGEQPPTSAVKSVQVQVSRLRRALGAAHGDETAARLRTSGNGYLLLVHPEELDTDRFQRLLEEGRRRLAAGDPASAGATIRDALGLWRGPPLGEFVYSEFAQAEIARLEELRLSALEERFDAELALGRHAAQLADLEAFVVEHPLRERPRAQLMLALYRSGRHAEALRVYEDARRKLAEELGLEPSDTLKRLQRAILEKDPALDLPAGRVKRPSEPISSPASRRWLVLGGAVLVAAAVGVALLEATKERSSVGLASLSADSVGRIDPRTNRLVAEIPVGARPSGIASGNGALWVANLDDGTVSRVDPEQHRAVHLVTIGTAPTAVAAGEGAVWAIGSDGVLRRIDPTFNAVSRRVVIYKPGNLLTSGSTAAGVAVGYGSVWTATGAFFSRPRVTRVSPTKNKIARTFATGNSPAAVAAGSGAIWVADNFENTVSRIDPSGIVTATPVGHEPQAIAVGEGAVWVVDSGDNAVVRIDPSTRSVKTTIPVGDGPSAIAVGAKAVWVANSRDGTVSRIDPAKNVVVKTIHVGNSPAGVAVTAGSVWVTSQAIPTLARAVARGGVARFDIAEDPVTDPAQYPDRQIGYATCAKLLNYPDKPAPEGTRLIPEAARSLPTRSADGRTYTFTIRNGFAFSPPLKERVTAETFKHSIERALDPRTHGSAIAFVGDIVGAGAFASGRATDVSGLVARGDKLMITLTQPAPSFLARIAMPLFCAVPVNTPPNARGIPAIPSAGPYYIASYVPHRQLVLKRNPNYRGTRPRRLDEIVYTIGIRPEASVTRVEQSRADYVAGRLPNEDDARLAGRYGPASAAARSGRQRYFVNPMLALGYVVLNTNRPLFASVRMRRAVNYAIDRRALAKQGSPISGPGAFTTIPTDQYLPSTMPGFERTSIYPLDGDLRTARRLVGGDRHTAVLYTCTPAPASFCTRQALIIKQTLKRIGISLKIRTFPFTVMVARMQRRGEPWDIGLVDWGADFVDPSSFLDLLAPSVDERFRAKLARAARLSGPIRYRTYGQLAVELAREAAPWVTYANGTFRDFFSARIGCQLFQPVYGMDLGALCTRR